MPSGSYKDRGATVLASRLKALRVKDIVLDSSGYAGAACRPTAGLVRLRDQGGGGLVGDAPVVILTGNGLKSGRKLADLRSPAGG